jgi:PleD family two-component response regulator
MLTNGETDAAAEGCTVVAARSQKVMIINGRTDALEALENVLDAGHYDIVFVESSAHAYTQIKRVRPNLVILCVEIDDAEGLHLLSMLKLDEETRGIPVLTFTPDGGGESANEELAGRSEEKLLATKPAAWMN